MKNLKVIVKKQNNSTIQPIVIQGTPYVSSGSWKINPRNLPDLVGGIFSAHETQTADSKQQGIIRGFTIDSTGRVVIIFEPIEVPVPGTNTSWGQEKAYY